MKYWLQDAPDDLTNVEYAGGSGVVDINMTSAALFVVIASGFLILLYKLMSTWFVVLLVVLFCIGGVEVCLFSFYCLTFSFLRTTAV